MYNMYPWDKPADPGQARRRRKGQDNSPATEAVQFALDRRDNGGDPASPASPVSPVSPAGRPTARQTRQ